ncbi:hypothetical protein [uncultured Sneathia sp.]|uniref:hypothetical protein n=1 Tax=uncultured Sneathia sp. TaxID=278067 RepID=UPI002597282E|nr:hypothetical protein [uncultured Sneathia sp.]
MNSREIVIKSRKSAMINIAYNINRMYSLPKLYSNYSYRSDNLIRIMSDLLRKGYTNGIYVTNKFIKENNLTIKEDDKYGTIFEYLKETDEETGKKEYRFFYMYNVEQLQEQDEKIANAIKIVDTTKHNLRTQNIIEYLNNNEEDILVKIIFNGLLNLKTGKHINLDYKLDKEAKNILIEMCKQDVYINEMRQSFKKALKLLKTYLRENEIKEGE